VSVRCAVSRPVPHRFARISFIRTGPLSCADVAAITRSLFQSCDPADIRQNHIHVGDQACGEGVLLQPTLWRPPTPLWRPANSMASLDLAHQVATPCNATGFFDRIPGTSRNRGRLIKSTWTHPALHSLPLPHLPNSLPALPPPRMHAEVKVRLRTCLYFRVISDL
jgi:hypothetical protein